MLKRILALAIALLFLAACAAPAIDDPIPEPAEETTTTTQPAPTTEPFIIAVEVDEDDPFSFVLRAYAEFALWNLEARHLHHEEWPAAFAQWEAEQPLLQHFTMRQGMESMWEVARGESAWDMHMEYALHDISGNGVDDLLIRFVSWRNPLLDIYSIVDGVPVQQMQNAPSQRVSMSVHPSGSVTRTGGGMGSFWTEIHRFVDGQLTFSTELASGDAHDENNNWYRSHYLVAGEPRDNWDTRIVTPISEQEYNRILAYYGINGQSLDLDWRPLFVPG